MEAHMRTMVNPSDTWSLDNFDNKFKITNTKERNSKIKKSKTCSENFNDFSSSTSIHGIQYLGANKKSLFERLWWFIMIIVSFSMCCYFIKNLWNKWDETPVVVTFAETATPIWQIPFPAITVCSKNRVAQSKFNVTEKIRELKEKDWSEFTDEEKEIFRTVFQACGRFKIPKDEDFTDEKIVDRLKHISTSIGERFLCSWKRKSVNCSVVWNSVTSDKGFCYTFNALDPTEIFRENTIQYHEHSIENRRFSEGWTLEKGYPKNTSPIKTYPRRISSSTVTGAFELSIITLLKEYSHLCSESDGGYRISLHPPSDHPRMSQDYFIAPLKQYLFIAIKPTMITTSPEVANYDASRRQCFMEDEKKLKYFKIYSLKNCEWECLTNYTLISCGCVAYWMPRESWMPICSVRKSDCIKNARYSIEDLQMLYEYAESIGNTSEINKLETIRSSCHCMPTCTSLSYEVVVTQNPHEMSTIEKLLPTEENDPESWSYMTLRFFFAEAHLITKRRSELYGINDFLSNCGGILGFFMGFSLLSFIEIVYFAIIRPICSLRNARIKSK